MSTPQDTEHLLQSFTRRHEVPRISFRSFLEFVRAYADRSAPAEDTKDLRQDAEQTVLAHLNALQREQTVRLFYVNGVVQTILYLPYYAERIRELYDRILERSELPFPDNVQLGIDIPDELIRPVDVKSELISWMATGRDDSSQVLRLDFPKPFRSMMVTPDLVPGRLLILAMQKLRLYLNSEKNAGYLRHKLIGFFPTREAKIREQLDQVLTNPRQAAENVENPSDFAFHFWAQLCSTIVKEAKARSDLIEEDHVFSQSAYLIAVYNAHFRNIAQKQRESEALERILDQKLRNKPYVFTNPGVMKLTDEHGVSLSQRLGAERLRALMRNRCEPDAENDKPAMLLRVRGPDEHDYYVYGERAVQIFLEKRNQLADVLKRYYVQHWHAALRRDRQLTSMRSDDYFAEHLRHQVNTRDPVFAGLTRFDILFNASQRPDAVGVDHEALRNMFDPEAKRLVDYPALLDLDRQRLLADAKLLLPFWQAIPVLRAVWRLFRRLGGDKGVRSIENDLPDEHRHEGTDRAKRLGRRRPETSERRSVATKSVQESASAHQAAGKGAGPADEVREMSRLARSQRSPEDAQAFRKQVRQLEHQLLGQGASLEDTLNELAESWNPLLDRKAKDNLIEDVNSYVRDAIRKLKLNSRRNPPSQERIAGIARELANKDAFEKVRRKEHLIRYIELYILYILKRIS